MVLEWLGIRWGRRNLLHQLCRWVKDRYNGTSFKSQLAFAAIANTVYMIWRNMNLDYWEHIVNTIGNTVKDIKHTTKHMVLQTLRKKVRSSEKTWLENL